MIKKGLSLVMLICALFSGQLMAGHKGHEYLWVKNVDHQLRHEADSDELRSAAEVGGGFARTPPVAEIAQTGHARSVISCPCVLAGFSSDRPG
jgi:hypothetical protein